MARVRFTARATASVRAQLAFLRTRDARLPDRLTADIARAALLLTEHPLAGRSLPGGRRERVIATLRYRYRLVHRVDGDDVVVLDVLHPRRGP